MNDRTFQTSDTSASCYICEPCREGLQHSPAHGYENETDPFLEDLRRETDSELDLSKTRARASIRIFNFSAWRTGCRHKVAKVTG